MGIEHILLIIGEVGVATGVFYSLFNWLFKNAFNDAIKPFNNAIEPLKNAVDSLSVNVSNQTRMLEKSLQQIEDIEKEVNAHETRLQLLEHERKDKDE